MKKLHKNYLMELGLLVCLIAGAFLWQPVVSRIQLPVAHVVTYDRHYRLWKDLAYLISNTPEPSPAPCAGEAPSFMYIGGGIPMYSQEAPVIIIGEVKKVGVPYYKYSDVLSQQDVDIDVAEVLKGNYEMKHVTVVTGGGTDMCDVIFKQGEKILLFLGGNGRGAYASFVGPNGKYLIDQNGNVRGDGIAFPIPLADVKVQISDSMKAPPLLSHPTPIPYTGEVHTQ
jgi:hypothetical protein